MRSFTAMLVCISIFTLSACSQDTNKQDATKQPVGGTCEGCEAVFESPVPLEKLSWIDTLPDFNEAEPKIMIHGIIYQADGNTPAKDVVLFMYHTGQDGNYSNKKNEKGWAKYQGYIRGWLKSNEKGEYKFYTLEPASYPNSTAVKHIHTIIKEPGKNEYWTDSFLFDDDPFLTLGRRTQAKLRGGDGIVTLKNENGILVGERNIYLGKNIPGYPSGAGTIPRQGPTVDIAYAAFGKYIFMMMH